MGTPTRYPSGVTNVTKSSDLGMFTAPDPTKNHVYFNDFDTYVAGDWTVTAVGTVSAAAIADVDGGAITLTTDAGATDSVYLDKLGESFLFAAGKPLWFKARLKVSNATSSVFVAGLQITDTSPLDVTDGVFFSKAAGTTALTLEVEKNNTATSSAVGVLANDTFVTMGFYYNGVDGISYFLDGVQIGTSAVTNLPDDELLTVSLGLKNTTTSARVLTVDYVLAAKAR
jgi:hypothetical protein